MRNRKALGAAEHTPIVVESAKTGDFPVSAGYDLGILAVNNLIIPIAKFDQIR